MAWLAQLLGGLPRVGSLTGRFFENLRVDDSFAQALANRRGPVVFVLRSVSVVDALATAHLAAQAKLPSIGFTHDLPWLAAAFGGGRARGASQEQALTRALEHGKTSLLFLKRPPSLFSQTGRGQTEGDSVLASVIEHAAKGNDVTLVPVVLLWTMRPDHRGGSPIDLVFGPTDMPGDFRAAMQALLAYQHGALRVGEPIDVRAFLESEGDESSYTTVRRLTYALLRRVERERRAVVGPARKSSARVREEVLRSPKLTKMMTDLASGNPAKHAELVSRAREMITELAAEPDEDLMRAVEPVADRLVRRVFAGIDVEAVGLEKTREAARKGTIVLLPSHKSHVDYLVLTYVLRKNLLELPVIAAGDNLSFFPVGELLRRGGAFFIRRDFRGDRLYAAVVDAYVRRLLRDGWAIEFYLEGGRSRTGRLLSPKLGLLNLVVDAALSLEGRTVSFVPVSINYDRLMEDFELAREKAGGKKERESARSLLAVADALKDDYGRVSVCFGDPIELETLRAELGVPAVPSPAKRRAVTNRLASLVMRGIHAHMLVGAGALVATALLDMQGRGLSQPELLSRCARLFATASRAGALASPSLVHVDGRIRDTAIRDAAIAFVRGGLLREHVPDDTLGRETEAKKREPRGTNDVIYTVPEEARSRLDLVKGCVLHFFADRALVSLSFLGARARTVPRARVRDDAASLGRMLVHELTHLNDGPLEERIDRTIDDMIAAGELSAAGESLAVGPGNDLADAMVLLSSHASHLLPLIEVLRIAARAVRVLSSEPLEEKVLLKRALSIGGEMFLGGEIDRREALSGPALSSAFGAFLERGLLKRNKDLLEPGPEGAPEAVKPLEAQLASIAAAPRVAWPAGGA